MNPRLHSFIPLPRAPAAHQLHLQVVQRVDVRKAVFDMAAHGFVASMGGADDAGQGPEPFTCPCSQARPLAVSASPSTEPAQRARVPFLSCALKSLPSHRARRSAPISRQPTSLADVELLLFLMGRDASHKAARQL